VRIAILAAQRTDNGCGENDVADQAQANEQDFHWRSRFSVLSSRFVFWFTFVRGRFARRCPARQEDRSLNSESRTSNPERRSEPEHEHEHERSSENQEV